MGLGAVLLTMSAFVNRYHSIRIDTVHYCEREIYLSERRKRRSFFDRNAEPEDTTQARLKLLCRTLREDPARLGPKVQFLKTPYMLRESCQADLARTIAVLPNLKYVDLPEGLFTDDPSFLTLRLEVQARCHGIRKMTYMGGAERSLQMLAGGAIWTRLEVLDLIKVNLDPTLMRQVLASLGNLRALKVSETQSFTDEVLYWNDMLPMVPPLEEFILTDVPYVTADGLKQWLMLPEAQQALKVLTLNRTGVKPWTLHEVVAATPALNHLSIIDTVTATMPAAAGTHNVPPLASMSIQTLHYEITPSAFPSAITTASYYNYLASSLLSGGLPNLCAVYVRDTNFPDTLLGLPPPMPSFADRGIVRPASSGSSSPFSSRFSSQSLSPAFAPVSPQGFLSGGGHSPPFAPPPLQAPHNPFLSPSDGRRSPGQNNRPGQGRSPPSPSPPNQWQPGHHPRFSSNNPFASMVSGAPPPPPAPQQQSIANLPHMLEVFTKGDDEIDWSFVKVNPGSALGPVGGGHHRHQSGAGSARRPSSSYGLGTDVMGGSVGGWNAGSGARRSIFVGGAGGGFLEVPTGDGGGGGGGAGRRRAPGSGSVSSGGEGEELWPRPKSSAGEKKWEGMDLWR